MSNPHFNNFFFQNDAQIIEDLTSDFIYDHGIGITYMPREDVNFDPVMNEPISSTFKNGYSVDIFVEADTSRYLGPNAVFDFAGFSYGKDNVTIHFDKRKFVAVVGKLPREGDLVYIREIDRTFEIIDLDKEDPMKSGGREFSLPATMRIFSPSEGTSNFEDGLVNQVDSDGLESILKALDPGKDLVDPTIEEVNTAQTENDPQVQNDRLKDVEPGTPSTNPNDNPFGFT